MNNPKYVQVSLQLHLPGKINLSTQILTMYLQKQASESKDEDIVIVCTLFKELVLVTNV